MKNCKIQIKDNKIAGIIVPVYFFRQKKRGVVFAECPALHLVTYGRTLEKAKEMFADELALWRDTANESGQAIEILRALGWQISKNQIVPAHPPIKVPMHLLGSSNICLHIGAA